jgi:hypothetical protein
MMQRVYEDMALAPIDLQDEWSQRLMQVGCHVLVHRVCCAAAGHQGQRRGNPCGCKELQRLSKHF